MGESNVVKLSAAPPSAIPAPLDNFDGLDTLSAFERFMVIYPRQEGHGRARQQWIWALGKCGNDFRVILAGAMSARVHHLAKGTDYSFIQLPCHWLADEGWRNVYELPKAAVAPSHDPAKARLESLRASAAKGNKFSADLLKRDYGE